jgi:hypothetical protein
MNLYSLLLITCTFERHFKSGTRYTRLSFRFCTLLKMQMRPILVARTHIIGGDLTWPRFVSSRLYAMV